MHPSEGFSQASEAECWACRTQNRMPEQEYAIVKVPLVVLLAQQGASRLRASGKCLVCSVDGAAASFLPEHMDWSTAAHGESSNLHVWENLNNPFTDKRLTAWYSVGSPPQTIRNLSHPELQCSSSSSHWWLSIFS